MARKMNFQSSKPKDTRGTLLRMLKYLASYKYLLFLAIALSFASNLLALQGPRYAGLAINEADAGAGLVNFDMVFYYAERMLFVYVASSILTVVINIVMTSLSKWIAQKMRKDVFDKLMRLPVSYYHHNTAGDIISRVSYDVDVVSTCIATDVTQILTSLVTVVGAFVMMVYLSPALSIVVLVTVPVCVGYTAYMRKKMRPRYSRRSKSYGALNGFVEEMLSGQKTIQAYAYEDEVCQRFDRVNTEAVDAYYDAEYYGSTIGPTTSFINNLSLALIAMLGTILYMRGAVSLDKISSFVLYSRKFSGPINEIANVVNEIFSAISAAERIFTLLDAPEEAADPADARQLEDVRGDVTLEHVQFGYDPGKIVLHDLSLAASSGKTVAIVGPTGAGKTTIISLLMRFYDASSGEIRVDGGEIHGYTRASVRKAYAMVLQDTWVFHGTIFDNIAYGKEDATMEEVVAAAKSAHIHGFIMRLPQGYSTVISEDGGNISKGQKQLLTIARAMLYDARMLILDEATSNVDTGTERQVQRAMRELMAGKTCFVIAHRLSTIRNADHILVVNHGDVVEQGTHETLMAQRGFYYKLYAAQFQ
ncbi:MAG: ABC transporter ATP-binding protein/permease [Firmicutes bacterium]|nr:ABC transporter ATP-binding protein/permease [Bacillota bacterium]